MSLYASETITVLQKDITTENLLKSGLESQIKGDYLKALDYLERANELVKNRDPIKECEIHVKIGLIKWNLGKMEESTHYYNTAQTIAQRNSIQTELFNIEKVLNIHNLYERGKAYRTDMRFQDSIDSFQAAIELAHEIGSKEHEVKCLRQQSISYKYSNDLNEFLRSSKDALKIAEALNHKIEESNCTNNIGWYYMQFSNYSTALEFFNRALQLAEVLGKKSSMPDILNNLGIIYKNLGEFDKALSYLNEALEIDREFGDLYFIALDLNDIGTTLRHIGLISGENKRLDEALDYYFQSLKIASGINEKKQKTEVEIAVFNNMGTIYSDLADYGKALDYFKQGYDKAVELNEIRDMGMLLNNMGIVHSNMGNYSESTAFFLKSIELGTRLNSGLILWEAYLELARSYVKQDRKNDALIKFQESISQIEKIRSQINLEDLKASFMGSDKRLEAYQEIIGLLVSLHNECPEKAYDEMAFNYLERGKARAFLDSLEMSQVDITHNVDFRLLNREAEITKKISSLYSILYASGISKEQSEQLNAQLEQKEDELEALKGEIRSRSPVYANLKYPSIISLKDAQKSLDSKTAFFEYTFGKTTSFAFVITSNDFRIFEIPSKDEIRPLVINYLKALSDNSNMDFSLGHKLYNSIMRPELKGDIKNIIIVADDILHYLPFETLLVSEKNNTWLINNHELAYASSISSLNEIIERKKERGTKASMDFLAFGDPYFGSDEQNQNWNNADNGVDNGQKRNKYTRLTFSTAEIEKTSALFRSHKTKIFQRENASEENLKTHELDEYKIIHFATHSEVDDERPLRSNIVLAHDDNLNEDGLLQAREIYNLDLNSDLVTISACESGLGKFIRGEGIEGLNRAFFFAGTSAVVMSLWAVNDQATSQLMERFYFYLRKSDTIVSALKKAKLDLIRSDVLAHPYYWAGFIASGKADTVIFPNQSRLIYAFGIFILIGIAALFIIKKKTNIFSGPV